MADGFVISVARGAGDMDIAREMFREYQAWLGVDLCFQGFEQELAGLPGAYAPPRGEIFIARDGGAVAGIVAIRPVGDDGDGRCEMKRLYVRDAWKGRGLGRRLAETVVRFGADAGYRIMVLDTLPQLETAKGLYLRMGFAETAPYYENPLPGVVYLEKVL